MPHRRDLGPGIWGAEVTNITSSESVTGKSRSHGEREPEKFIVAGVDGSAASACAARWAADEATCGTRSSACYSLPDPDRGSVRRTSIHRSSPMPSARRTGHPGPGCGCGRRRHPDLPIRKTLREADARSALDDESTKATMTVVGRKGKVA